jgi:hypothetical protein
MKTKRKTLRNRIVQISGELGDKFTSGDVIHSLHSHFHQLVINRGAINAAIETLWRHKLVRMVRRGAGRKATVWRSNFGKHQPA